MVYKFQFKVNNEDLNLNIYSCVDGLNIMRIFREFYRLEFNSNNIFMEVSYKNEVIKW